MSRKPDVQIPRRIDATHPLGDVRRTRGTGQMRLSLYTTIGIAAFSSVTVGVALVAVLTFLKANGNLAEMILSSQAFIAGTVQAQLETGLDLGIGIDAEANDTQVIAAAAAADPQIRLIEAFDVRGRVLAATGSLDRHDSVPQAWLQAIRAPQPGHAWCSETSTTLVVCLPLTNDFGKTVGGLAVSFSRALFSAESHAMLRAIIIGCAKVLAFALVVAMAAVLVMFRRTGRSFRHAAQALDGVGPDGPLPPFTPDPLAEVDVATDHFRHRVARGWQELEDAGQHLDAIGR